MSALRRLARRLFGERGQSMVEFAIVAPLVLIALFAVLEFAFVMTDQIELYNAARDGARAGAIPTGQTRAAMQTDASATATTSSGAAIGCTPSVPTPTFDNSSPAVPTEITVTVNCTYTWITPLGKFLGGLGVNVPIKGTSTRLIEP
jgi:Flp pilus assembly protein TadG